MFSFNLVIEVLFFSSQMCPVMWLRKRFPFQSRNRGSFLFKLFPIANRPNFVWMFQSRNRGSFLFKEKCLYANRIPLNGFNLVIEVLFFSREYPRIDTREPKPEFQSRNRGSFLFKTQFRCDALHFLQQFQSRNRGSFLFKATPQLPWMRSVEFQSRNRGSFLFKEDAVIYVFRGNESFQSRNRGSFLFKSPLQVSSFGSL